MNCLPLICLLLKTLKAEATIAMAGGTRALLILSAASSYFYLSLEIKLVTIKKHNNGLVVCHGNQNEYINYAVIFFANLEQPQNELMT